MSSATASAVGGKARRLSVSSAHSCVVAVEKRAATGYRLRYRKVLYSGNPHRSTPISHAVSQVCLRRLS